MFAAQHAAQRRGQHAAMRHHDHDAARAARQSLKHRAAAGSQLGTGFASGNHVVDVARPPPSHLFREFFLQIGPQVPLEDARMKLAQALLHQHRQTNRGGDHVSCLTGPLQRARPDLIDRDRLRQAAAPLGHQLRLRVPVIGKFDVGLSLNASLKVGDALAMTH